jgi:hypothetical protein
LPTLLPRVRAFNALTPQDARRDFGTPGNRVPTLFHQLPGGGHPRRYVALCGEVGVSSVTLCRLPRTANTPSPRRGADSTLECLFRECAGPCRDVGPAGAVIPVAVSPVRPSPLLLHHAGHCDDIPTLLGRTETRRRHDGYCATYGPSSTTLSNRPTTEAGRPTATPPPSKPLLYEHRTHHDTSTGAGFTRTAVSSAALLAIPPHVGK